MLPIAVVLLVFRVGYAEAMVRSETLATFVAGGLRQSIMQRPLGAATLVTTSAKSKAAPAISSSVAQYAVSKINFCLFKKKHDYKNKNKPAKHYPLCAIATKMAVLSSRFFPAQTETTIATPLFTNSTPYFGN